MVQTPMVCSDFQLGVQQLEHTWPKHLAGAFDLYGCHVTSHPQMCLPRYCVIDTTYWL